MKKTNVVKTERRAFISSELRALVDGGKNIIGGHAIVFNSPSVDLGGFVEVCDAGMLTRTLREQPDILALRDHDSTKLLGRTTAGTLALKVDDKGLAFRISVPDTEVGRDTFANVKNKNLSGVSFGFTTRSDSWSQTADGQIVRRLLDIDLAEISPTSFPAYPGASVSLRSCPVELRSLLDPSLLDIGGLFDDGEDDEEDPLDADDLLGGNGIDEADFQRHARLKLALRRVRV